MCRRECGSSGLAAVAEGVLEVSALIGERRACKQFGIARASFQRLETRRKLRAQETLVEEIVDTSTAVDPAASASRQVQRHLDRQARKIRRASPRALSTLQRQELLGAVHQSRFVDRSVPYIYATLLSENRYYASISTIYRLLRSVGEVGERRDQATRPAYVKPELCATGPNQVYAWDITKLHGPQKWTYFYLYVIIDIYSRYVVGWMVADRES